MGAYRDEAHRAVDKLLNVTAMCRRHNLSSTICVFCDDRLAWGDWAYICTGCRKRVTDDYYHVPAIWITELVYDTYKRYSKDTVCVVRRGDYDIKTYGVRYNTDKHMPPLSFQRKKETSEA